MSVFTDHIASADDIILERFKLEKYLNVRRGQAFHRTYLIDKRDPGSMYKHTSYITIEDAWDNYIAGKRNWFDGFQVNYQPKKQTFINKLSKKISTSYNEIDGRVRILILNGITYYNVGDLIRFESLMDHDIIQKHRGWDKLLNQL